MDFAVETKALRRVYRSRSHRLARRKGLIEHRHPGYDEVTWDEMPRSV